jgi:hypothetical protein
MTAVFIGVLLASFCIQKLFDPAGQFAAALFRHNAAPANSRTSGIDRASKAP